MIVVQGGVSTAHEAGVMRLSRRAGACLIVAFPIESGIYFFVYRASSRRPLARNLWPARLLPPSTISFGGTVSAGGLDTMCNGPGAMDAYRRAR